MAGLTSNQPVFTRIFTRIAELRAVMVPLAFILLLVVIVIPIPPVIMDALIAVNICVAVIMLMTTMYNEEPLQFSVFPSLLLGTTLLRLVLNVASTRLILSVDASTPEEAVDMAGKVISAFGTFVAGGEVVVGVIMFLILVVIQFIVITKGATRISEVAARFTLDAMPGKQMAIDADLNAGIITEQEARDRRERISREADFFGAMDGASKFVRGDAIAGIIITVVNIVGGFAIGALSKGWSLSETVEIFTVLTIGDGLASQIPSFVIAISAALIVTRSGADSSLGNDITSQLGKHPMALYITAGFVTLLAFTPMPAFPMLTLAVILVTIGVTTTRQRQSVQSAKQVEAQAEAEASVPKPQVEDLLKVDTLELEVGYGLVSLVDAKQGGDLLDRISAIRRQMAAEIGLVMPPVRIRDNMTFSPNEYHIKIRGNSVGQAETRPGALLAMDSGIATGKVQGEPTREPAFGLEAWWINPNLRSRAETMNFTVVDPTSVLTTHLAEIVKDHADELLTREEVNNLIEQLKDRAPKLVEEAIPSSVTPGELQKVLQTLLRERVPIRDLETILETLSDWAGKTKDLDVLTEYVRNSLRRAICAQYTVPAEPNSGDSPKLTCVTLDPEFEDVINGYIDRSSAGTTISMPASVANAVARHLVDSVQPVINKGCIPVIIASPQVRAQVRQLIEPHMPAAAVLGYNEVVSGVDVESLALVEIPESLRAGQGAA